MLSRAAFSLMATTLISYTIPDIRPVMVAILTSDVTFSIDASDRRLYSTLYAVAEGTSVHWTVMKSVPAAT